MTRILTAVKELLAFESSGERIDGINLDDYFSNNANLEEQVAEFESKGVDGYVFFFAQYLFRNCAVEELANVNKQ